MSVLQAYEQPSAPAQHWSRADSTRHHGLMPGMQGQTRAADVQTGWAPWPLRCAAAPPLPSRIYGGLGCG